MKNISAFVAVAIKEKLSRLGGINPEIEHDTAALQEAIDRYESLDGEKTRLENTITTLKEKISKQKPKKGDKP
jgi:chromosome segregation ATPase